VELQHPLKERRVAGSYFERVPKWFPLDYSLPRLVQWVPKIAVPERTISEGSIMKSLVKAVALGVVLAAPVASFAQTEQPLTRAEVKAQLKQIEQAGYNPAKSTDATYPADIQAAEARVAAQNATAQADTTGYGTTATGSTQTGGSAAGANTGQ
jgi:hypothetical protein